MRKALNENPVVQAALIGVLALGVGILLLMRMGGSSSESTTTDAAATEAVAAGTPATGESNGSSGSQADATAPAAGSAASATGSAPAAGAAAPSAPEQAAPAGATSDFTAGPGLPASVVNAYDDGQAVVLLIVNEKGIDDRELARIVAQLQSHPEATVILVKVKDVADYSRITEGVDLSRTPAMVVIRPKKLDDGPMPTAVISYGFRGGTSAEQALDDALYKGPSDLPYYPR